MAPGSSSRGQTAQPGRSLRSSSSASTRSTRGGIQKRRGGSGRVDSDGDLDMDGNRRGGGSQPPGAPRGSRGRAIGGRGSSRAAQAVARHLNGDAPSLSARVTSGADKRTTRGSNLTWLKIRGLKQSKAASNEGGGLKDLLVFLERKAGPKDNSRRVMIRKSRMSGDYVYVGATAEDASEVLKLNTFVFAGAALEITPYNDESSSNEAAKTETSAAAQDLKSILQGVLGARYDGNAKLLSLNSLAQDPTLAEMGSFQSTERATKTFMALMKICDDLFKTAKEKQEAIESISLAGNNIDNVAPVNAVADTFPSLKNLDLSGNQLANAAGLAPWKGKFRRLETLLVAGNPIVASDPNYANTLLEMFPRLQHLDGVQVRTPEQVAQVAAARQPKPLPQHGPDFRDTSGIGEAFLVEFFATFDADRQGLLAKYYDNSSSFSLAVDTNSVRDANAPPPMAWAAYLKFSRNLKRITHDNARIQRLFQGRNVISELWKSLPLTRHPDIKSETNKYVMDCHTLSGLADPSNQAQRGVDGLIIAVHGEFDESDRDGKTGKRSFSRTFVLGPGVPGGNPIRVVSDMLCLRANNPLPNIFDQQPAQPVHPAQPTTTPQPPPAQQQNQQQQALIAEMSKQTGMTAAYSEMCLQQGNWNFDQAMALFNQTKATLGPEAWAVPPASIGGNKAAW